MSYLPAGLAAESRIMTPISRPGMMQNMLEQAVVEGRHIVSSRNAWQLALGPASGGLPVGISNCRLLVGTDFGAETCPSDRLHHHDSFRFLSSGNVPLMFGSHSAFSLQVNTNPVVSPPSGSSGRTLPSSNSPFFPIVSSTNLPTSSSKKSIKSEYPPPRRIAPLLASAPQRSEISALQDRPLTKVENHSSIQRNLVKRLASILPAQKTRKPHQCPHPVSLFKSG